MNISVRIYERTLSAVWGAYQIAQLVDYSNPDAIVGFINQTNMDDNWKTGVASLVMEQSEYLNVAGKKAKRGKMSPVTAGEARIFTKQIKKSTYELT